MIMISILLISIFKDVKAILLINYQRKKDVRDREPIHEKQIKQAEKYGNLIIDSLTILKILERFRSNQYTQDDCVALIRDNIGLLVLDK